MKAVWNNTVIAHSEDVVEIEGNTYLPLASLDQQVVVCGCRHDGR